MSKFGRVVFECQEVAEANINQPRETVIEVAEKVFKGDSYKVSLTVQEWQKIHEDMWQVF